MISNPYSVSSVSNQVVYSISDIGWGMLKLIDKEDLYSQAVIHIGVCLVSGMLLR